MTDPGGATLPEQAVDAFRLDGYVAIITGASKGIGAGIAHEFALAGADVVLVARSASVLENVAAGIRATGRSASIIAADLSDVLQAGPIVQRTMVEHGRLDILVNNAGGAMPTPYLDTTPAALDEAFHFNVSAPFELTKQATPYLLGSGRGSVINITSRMDRFTARQMVIYGTIKAALSHLTRMLAVELAPGIRVNGIAPGVVETDALRSVLSDEVRQRIVAATPLHRLSSITDIANTARWLASPAGSYITGKIIEIDGGAEAPTFPDNTPDLSMTAHQDRLRPARPHP